MTSGPAFPFPSRDSGGGDKNNSGSQNRSESPKIPALLPALIIVAALVGLFILFAHFYTDVLWFDQLGFASVFWTKTLTQVALFAIGAVVMGGAVWLQLNNAWRKRPKRPSSAAGQTMRMLEETPMFRRLGLIVVPVLLGIFSGVTLTSGWQVVQLWLHRTPFGTNDPEFGLDISFFVMSLPFFEMVVAFLISVTLVSGIAGVVAHYLTGGVAFSDSGKVSVTRSAGLQLGISGALVLLAFGLRFWLESYSTVLNQLGRVPGALYSDVHAVIPTKFILAGAALIAAVLFVVAGVRGKWRLPLIATAMLAVVALVAGFAFPAALEQFKVKPSQKSMERPYIQRNIDATRAAYGLEDVELQNYDAKTQPEKNALTRDAATTTNIRLLDPTIVSPTFAQLQQQRGYYTFPDTLAVDRYTLDGKSQDTVIAARELAVNSQTVTNSWVNQHITYTHGYGVVAAYGNKVSQTGDPQFMLENIPSQGVLGDDSTYEPRIYFGKSSPQYSIVGGPEGWEPRELDRPAGSDGKGERRNTFSGDGGPNVGSFLNKLSYAIKFGSMDILLSGDVNAESQILYDRHPQDRVKKVAPFLTVDTAAYPAIIDGRVKWIVDAYTTTNNYPYSTSQQLGDAVRDTLTRAQGASADQFADNVNYIRNSVKATVDAYDGSVELYAWEPDEPLLKAWSGVFPNAIKPMSEMSPKLMEHVRYPEDMFKVQRELLGKYHVEKADDFYEGNDAWQVPNDPTAGAENPPKQPPYYMSLRLPGEDKESFSLTSSFIPEQSAGSRNQRNVMYGFIAANGDAGSTPGKVNEDYGKITLLKLPTQTTVPGPGQAQQNFNSNPLISKDLNLLSGTGGSTKVIKGNLLSLPVGGGILYVQPVYVQSTGETSYPSLRKVLVSYGNSVGYADSLSEALDQVFGGDSGAQTGESGPIKGGGSKDGKGGDSAPLDANARLTDALKRANQAIKDGEEALGKQDFAAYGKAQQELQKALEDATAADEELNGAANNAADGAADDEQADQQSEDQQPADE